MIEGPETSASHSLSSSAARAEGSKPWLSLLVLVAGSLAVTLTNLPGSQTSNASGESQNQFLLSSLQSGRRDYSSFGHTNAAHSRLPCLLCHRREDNSPQPLRSTGHTPCAGCHAQEFANSGGPICTICHANVQSSKPQVKPFPSLKTFNMKFDHARHQSVACATCHKP